MPKLFITEVDKEAPVRVFLELEEANVVIKGFSGGLQQHLLSIRPDGKVFFHKSISDRLGFDTDFKGELYVTQEEYS